MSTIDTIIDQRLRRWASWLASGDSAGYPRVNVLHPSWAPPSPGARPVVRAGRRGVEMAATHAAVGQLSLRLRNAVVMHYCLHLPAAQAAERQGCAPGTVGARLADARRQLWGLLDATGEGAAAPEGTVRGGAR